METATQQRVTYNVIAGARPNIARRDLTAATAVSLARNGSTVTGRQNLSAVDTGLEGVGLRGTGLKPVGQSEGASGKEGDDRDSEELHFGRILQRGGCLEWSVDLSASLRERCLSDCGLQLRQTGVVVGPYMHTSAPYGLSHFTTRGVDTRMDTINQNRNLL